MLRRAGFMSSIWILYLLGAVIGTWLNSIWGIRALLFPAVVVASILIADQWTPLAVEEEHDEPER